MVRIAFLGDIALFADGTLSGGWMNKFQSVADELSKYDLVVANLEAPITESCFTAECKGIHLKTTSKMIDVLKYLKVRIVSLANNHACDFGIRGLEDTVNALEAAGIKYYGVNGKSETLLVKNEPITFHGYCCYSANGSHYSTIDRKKGINALTRERVLYDLQEDSKKRTLPVLSMHWGDEYSNLPNEKQVHFMHELADKYTFVLHGHHTHAMQGIEEHNGSLLAYSQGNFCFDEVHSTVNKSLQIKQSKVNAESFILSIAVEDGTIVEWSTTGLYNSGRTVELIDNKERIRSFSDMIAYCEKDEYKAMSREMIHNQKINNLGKRDIKWLMSKLNYYSIGAKILWYRNNRLYKNAY